MSALGALAFWPVAWALGRVLLPARRILPRSLWEEVCVSYLLGCGLIAVLGTAGVAVGLPFAATFSLTASAGLAACGWLAWRRRVAPDAAYAPLAWPWFWLALLMVLGLGAAALTLALPLNETDPILHFAYRGKVLLHRGTVLDEALLGMQGPEGFGRVATHPNYPLGIPVLEAWAASLGGWSDRWVQAPLAWWTACLPGAVAFALRDHSEAAARRAALLAACTPMLYAANLFARGGRDWLEAGLGGATTLGGGADLPVAALFGAACALWLRSMTADCRRAGVAAGVAFAGAAMMKNEGLALAGVACIATLTSAALPGRPRLRPQLACWLTAALAIAPWLYVRAQLPAIDENYGEQFQVTRLLEALGGMEEPRENLPPGMAGDADGDAAGGALQRRTLVAQAFGGEFMDLRTWGLLWLAVAVALVPTARHWRDARSRWLALIVLGGVALYAAILLVTPWYFPSLRDKGIPERLLVHLVAPCAMLVGFALAPRRAE